MAKHKKKPKRSQHLGHTIFSLPGSKTGLWRRLLKAAPVILIAIFLTIILSRFGVLHELETVGLDLQMRLNKPVENSPVAIINITDEDYQHIFNGRSPLDADKLHQLIDSISAGGPRLIAVDIDTSDESFKKFQIGRAWPPVIWQREVILTEEEPEAKPKPLEVLGGQDPMISRSFAGVALLIDDAKDKVTRRYRRIIETTEGPVRSFPWAIVSKLPDAADLRETTETFFINYAGDREGSHRIKLNASRVLEVSESEGWRKESPIKNRVVLLGGSYLDQDRHDTPLGVMNGVDILANVIETEMQGGGLKPPNLFAVSLLQIFDAFLLVILFHQTGWKRGLLLCIPLLPSMALLCSYIAFNSFARWAYFAPILLGVLSHKIVEQVKDYRKELVMHAYDDITSDMPNVESRAAKHH